MELRRVIELPLKDAKKIYAALENGTMTYYEDKQGYAMYDVEEYNNYTPKKRGRPCKNSRSGR